MINESIARAPCSDFVFAPCRNTAEVNTSPSVTSSGTVNGLLPTFPFASLLTVIGSPIAFPSLNHCSKYSLFANSPPVSVSATSPLRA